MSERHRPRPTDHQPDPASSGHPVPSDDASARKISLGTLVFGAVVGFVIALVRPRSWR